MTSSGCKNMPDGVIFALPLASFVAAVFLKCRSKDSESNRIRQMLFHRAKIAAQDFQTACIAAGDVAMAALETDLSSSQITIRSVIAEEAAKTAGEK